VIVGRRSNPVRDPGRILATPEFKVNDRHRTRTESELTLSTMLADFDPKYPRTRAYFPSERLLAIPKVLIPFAPPNSPQFSRSLRRNRKYCAYSRTLFDLRAPENLSFGRPQVINARFSLSRTEPVPFA